MSEDILGPNRYLTKEGNKLCYIPPNLIFQLF